MATFTGDRRTINQILSVSSPPIEVPYWQRNFSWGPEEIETFWSDLIAFEEMYPGKNIDSQEYFLGSIVLVNTLPTYQILDGQQRLATATILLSVIRDYENKFNPKAGSSLSQQFIFKHDFTTGSNSFKLTMSNYDREFFRQEIQEEREPTWVEPKAELLSHQKIRDARSYFDKQLEDQYATISDDDKAYQWALRLQNVLTDHLSVVSVETGDEDSASMVFETLNDRGIGLSTTDLVRTLLLRRGNEEDVVEIESCWETVLQLEGRVDEFLRHYWLSIHGDVKTKKLYRVIKQDIEKNSLNSLEFSRTLQSTANTYRDLINSTDDDSDVADLLQSINQLGAKSLLPALLSADVVEGTANEKKRFVKELLIAFMRHNVIGGLQGTRFETFVYGIATSLRVNSDWDLAHKNMVEFAPTDDRFKAQFRIAQVGRQATSRYILTEFEKNLRPTEELKVQTPKKVHVEHIYPKNPIQGERLTNHNALVDRLGNLTLLDRALNQSIKNSPFKDKTGAYSKSDLLITKQLTEFGSWGEQSINQRQEIMSEIAPALWAFED